MDISSKFIYESDIKQQIEQSNQENLSRRMLEAKGQLDEIRQDFVLLVLDETYQVFFHRLPCFRDRSCIIELHQRDSFKKFRSLSVRVMQLCPDDTRETVRDKLQRHAQPEEAIPDRRLYRCVLVDISAPEMLKRWSVSEVVFSILRRMFYFVGVKRFHPFFYACFSDRDQPAKQNAQSEKYLIGGGIGDSLIHVPYLYYLQHHNRIDRKIISYHDSKNAADAVRFFTHSALANGLTGVMFFSQANKNMFLDRLRDMHIIGIPEGLDRSYFEYLSDQYPIDAAPQEIFRYFRQNYVLPTSHRLSSLKRRYRYVIGFQRCSGTNVDGQKCKELPVELARDFVRRCRAYGIAVVNLEPAEQHAELYDADISGLHFNHILPAMTELDAMVGVDSCFGHAAALLNVPSITIFVTTYLVFRYIEKFFMPISRNYSLFPVDYATIESEKIFQVLTDILTGRLCLSDRFVPLCERREFVNYEFV